MSARGSDPEATLGAFLRHGGRLALAEAAFPRAPRPWIDLSTGINPQPWRGVRARFADLTRLPDPAGVARLEALAAAAFGCEPARVAATPGAEAALRLLPRLTGARSVAIASPTYGAHAEAWAEAGAVVQARPHHGLTAVRSDALVAVNPNNPDGQVVSPDALAVQARARWTLVDESFADPTPDLSLAPRAGGRLVVLRSFGKFYGLPGVRLGFVVAEPALAARVRAAFGDWPISAEALAAGLGAYADMPWRDRTAARLGRDSARLARLLTATGFRVVGGCSLFQLAECRDAAEAFQALAEHGVLTRPFADRPAWLRFGLPAPRDWPRLTLALEACQP